MKLQIVLFLFFFQILRFEIGGAAYLRMRLMHGRLRYTTLTLIRCRQSTTLLALGNLYIIATNN